MKSLKLVNRIILVLIMIILGMVFVVASSNIFLAIIGMLFPLIAVAAIYLARF